MIKMHLLLLKKLPDIQKSNNPTINIAKYMYVQHTYIAIVMYFTMTMNVNDTGVGHVLQNVKMLQL